MANVLRGAYMAFDHDWPESWRWLEAWQPSVVVLLLPGGKDPQSVSLEKVARTHRMHPHATIVLRVWEVDDNNGEAMGDMMADPLQKAVEDADYWAQVFDRLPHDVRERCAAHLINEPHPREQGAQIRDYTGRASLLGKVRAVPMMVYNFSVGEPPLAGEHQFGWPYFAALEDDFIAGNHIVGFHSYFQPEGMYGVWIDDQGNERRDYGYLVGRHLKSGITRAKMCWSEWGLEGSIYNRHTGRGWLNYPKLWWPERYADEYVECCRIAAPNVIGICPYIDDHEGWKDFHLGPAYDEFLARKHLCVSSSQPTDPDPPGPQPPSPPPNPPEPVPNTTWRGIVVASAGLNIRSGPGTEHTILTAAPEDAVLGVHTAIPQWLEVEYDRKRGYAASRYLMLATQDSAVSVPDDGPTEPVSEAMRTLWELWGNQIWDLAREYNVPLATLAAVVMAESGGRAFDDAGRLIVRFENHVFHDLWGKDHPETFARHFRYGDPPWTGHQWRLDDGMWRMCHVDNRQEHRTLIFARSLANEAALQATSMGLPQILGMGHRAAGFTSAAEMFAAFQGDRSTHLPAMLHWIAKHGLIDELQRDDYYAFSVIYNGSGNAAVYSRIIESNVRQFERMFAEMPA